MSTDAAPRAPRPTIIGPDSGPEPPFPLRMEGKVISGFGRGSKELGIPTANIPVTDVPWIESAESGVYFGLASLLLPPSLSSAPQVLNSKTPTSGSSFSSSNWRTYPMVMSIGYNPFYKNTVRSAEVHVMHSFDKDFYGAWMRVSVLGFIRKELDYVDVESLIRDIRMDIEVAGRSLEREGWRPEGEMRWLEGDAFEKLVEGKEKA